MLGSVARFYGWGHSEMMAMDYDNLLSYYAMIEPLSAREAMSNSQIASYPHMNKADAKKVWQDLKTKSNRLIERQNAKFGDVYDKLRKMVGNG